MTYLEELLTLLEILLKREAYDESRFQLVSELSKLEDSHKVIIRADANDILCKLAAKGKHCINYRRDRHEVAEENKTAQRIYEGIIKSGGEAELRTSRTEKGISFVVTSWGNLKKYWDYMDHERPGFNNLIMSA